MGYFPAVRGIVSLASAMMLGAGLADAAHADGGLSWRLEAQIPALCAIDSIVADAADDRKLTVSTQCNLPRYAMLVASADGPAEVIAARAAGGQADVRRGRIEITTQRPGLATIEIILARRPPETGLAIALAPLG